MKPTPDPTRASILAYLRRVSSAPGFGSNPYGALFGLGYRHATEGVIAAIEAEADTRPPVEATTGTRSYTEPTMLARVVAFVANHPGAQARDVRRALGWGGSRSLSPLALSGRLTRSRDVSAREPRDRCWRYYVLDDGAGRE